jgi:hypothetical protein
VGSKIHIILFFVLFLIVSTIIINYFVFDVTGTGLGGLYKCEYKEVKNVTLKGYYSPRILLNNAQMSKMDGHINTGFGEPDTNGSSVYITKTINDRTYEILINRLPDFNWQNETLSVMRITNSCSTPNYILYKDLKEILGSLEIDNSVITFTSIRQYNTIHWFNLNL